MDALTLTDRDLPGANRPPEPDPFQMLSARADDLYLETGNFADGAEIQSEAEFQAVERLIGDWKTFTEACIAIRDELKAPHTAQVNAIQEQFYPLIGDTQKVTGIAIRAKKVLLQAKTKWGNKQDAIREAEAKRLRDEAAAQAKAAADAARDAAGNLEATEQAEDLIRAAQTTLRAATHAEKPAVKGMRSFWVTEMVDPVQAARWAWERHRPECEEFFLSLAKTDVREGKRTISGFSITEDRRAV